MMHMSSKLSSLNNVKGYRKEEAADMEPESSEPSPTLPPSQGDGSLLDERTAVNLSATTIPSLLKNVKQQKRSLEDEIRATSGDQSSNVKEWIAQAKKIQRDIARCKIEAAEIVKEHEQVWSLRASTHDKKNKVQLLEGEVLFTTYLQQELKGIADVKQSLDEVQESLDTKQLTKAAGQLSGISSSVAKLRSENARNILQDRQIQLKHDAHHMLEAELAKQITFGGNVTGDVKETWITFAPQVDTADVLLVAMKHLGTLQKTTEALASNADRSLMQPLLSLKSVPSVVTEVDTFCIKSTKGPLPVSNEDLLDMLRQAIKFLYTHLPDLAVKEVGQQLMPNLVSTLIGTRLSSKVPTELSDISTLQATRDAVSALANDLKFFRWPGSKGLQLWVSQLPLIWLGKRKMASLNALRNALSSPRGPTREVERIERQAITKQDADAMNGVVDDWDAGWDEDAQEKPDQANEEASGWGFDDDEVQPSKKPNEHQEGEAEDSADAWGWDDDNDASEKKKTPSPKTQRKLSSNGEHLDPSTEQEITLVERYTITYVPDHVLEIIGKDLRDADEVKESPYSSLSGANPSAGLQAIPSHTLAMFRAMATTYYSRTLPSGNMHLYNDASYIVQKLREASLSTSTNSLEEDCQIMDRFTRAAYAREMELQRTILGDILDGSQGFQSCTQQPYAMQCETAVSSAVDRVRTMHAEWHSILSHSALLQSIGSLVSTITDKITRDILDMEDISEHESQRLTSFCNQVSTLDDLFLAEKPADADKAHEAVPQTLIYVPLWLRFQYLANILESSLVDIKYLWKESELRMEFTADEVVDLIRALFAETRQRRDAIAEIRS
jgi:protein transport protein DSL1/ZW10